MCQRKSDNCHYKSIKMSRDYYSSSFLGLIVGPSGVSHVMSARYLPQGERQLVLSNLSLCCSKLDKFANSITVTKVATVFLEIFNSTIN